MKRYFLVDFENVSDSGLQGYFDLKPEDAVLIFYTQRANKINIDFFESVLENKSAAKLTFIRVAYGNQALDLQLASYLGGLITEDPQDCAYYIVSKDKGFHCLPTFWMGRYDSVKLYQVPSIANAINTDTEEPEHTREKAPTEVPPALEEEKKPETNMETDAVPAPVPQQKTEEEKLPQTVAKATSEEQPQAAKPVQERQTKNRGQATPSADRSAINTKVQQTLSKAKYDTHVISYVASLTTKNIGDSKVKQIVYRDIIKQYGQKKGLEIYNLIKPLLK